MDLEIRNQGIMISKVKEFNSKIKSGEIEFNNKSCPCSSTKFTKLFNYDRHLIWQPVVICKVCGLIQSNPQMTDEEYSKFYTSDLYREIYEGDDYLKTTIDRYNNTNQIFEYLEPLIIENNFKEIIEFGCGGGWNLLPFKNNNYNIVGYDYSQSLTKYGKDNYNLDLRQGSFDDVLNDGKKYDVVILSHIIEHFTDLLGNLQQISKIIKQGGIIYTAIPNIELFGRGQFQNAHTYYFTPKTFCHYMQRSGFQAIKFGPDDSIHMHGIFKTSKAKNNFNKISLTGEYNKRLKKILLGVLKIRITEFLDLLNILSLVKKLIGR